MNSATPEQQRVEIRAVDKAHTFMQRHPATTAPQLPTLNTGGTTGGKQHKHCKHLD
jgi:hypothetical protein